MAFDVAAGKSKRVRPQMNVTPLVDVVLVLLIIFLVITPLMQKQFFVHLPKEETQDAAKQDAREGPTPIVVTVGAAGEVQLNGAAILDAALPEKLRRVFAARRERVLFFDADARASYARAVQVLDLARGAGATSIAILTEQLTR